MGELAIKWLIILLPIYLAHSSGKTELKKLRIGRNSTIMYIFQGLNLLFIAGLIPYQVLLTFSWPTRIQQGVAILVWTITFTILAHYYHVVQFAKNKQGMKSSNFETNT